MKKISIVIPTFNEENNIIPLEKEIRQLFESRLNNFDYEIIFIDNYSVDKTREKIKIVCNDNEHVFAIFNAKNFGAFNSSYYGILQATGDAVIFMCADFQDPVKLILQFVDNWQSGYKIIIGKNVSRVEKKTVFFLKKIYYKLIHKLTNINFIEYFTGFGLYDKVFINILRAIDDPMPLLRGMVAELGYKMKIIEYQQNKSKSGKSRHSLYDKYDSAMLVFTSYSKIGLRLIILLGFFSAIVCILIALFYFVNKLMFWDKYSLGISPTIIGLFLLGSIQIIILCLIGEYILSINQRVMHKPIVIEECRYGAKYNNLEKVNFNAN